MVGSERLQEKARLIKLRLRKKKWLVRENELIQLLDISRKAERMYFLLEDQDDS